MATQSVDWIVIYLQTRASTQGQTVKPWGKHATPGVPQGYPRGKFASGGKFAPALKFRLQVFKIFSEEYHSTGYGLGVNDN